MNSKQLLVALAVVLALIALLAVAAPVVSTSRVVPSGSGQSAGVSGTAASPQVTVAYFYRTSCPACQELNRSGILSRISGTLVPVTTYDLDKGEGEDLYAEVVSRYRVQPAIPMAVVISAKTGDVKILIGYPDIESKLEPAVRGDLGS
jgi:thiol-disulfide isomerase/thioredoxin